MSRSRALLAAVAVVVSTGMSWGLLATPSNASPAVTITVQVSPSSIVANGISTATVTAHVTGSNGAPVLYDTISFSSSDPGISFSSVHNDYDGNYSATLTSSKTAGRPTITATDTSTSPPSSASTTLTQTPGPATTIELKISPSSIPGNGSSTAMVAATVTDANGNPVPGENIVFSSSDAQESIGPTVDHQDGTYSAEVTSSTNSGHDTITATDQSAPGRPTGQAVLIQTPVSHTSLSASPNHPATNQTVTLSAAVTTNGGSLAGTVSFKRDGNAIAGCGAVPITPSASTAVCHASFAASTSPANLAAVFTPQAGSDISSSADSTTLSVQPDATATALTITNQEPSTGGSTTYTATVRPRDAGALSPSGTVGFTDDGTWIPSCRNQPLTQQSDGALVAACTLSYPASGKHAIRAVYNGDSDFLSSRSPLLNVSVSPLRIGATMRWTFYFTPAYTKVLVLVLHGVPTGATVVAACSGRGCPFEKRTVASPLPCGATCGALRSVELTGLLSHRPLRPGAVLTVEITQPGRIGKYYAFRVRAGRGPRTRIRCVAPGSSRPALRC